jgi:AraC-like DNA-binding protein
MAHREVPAQAWVTALLSRDADVSVPSIGATPPGAYHDRFEEEHLLWFVLRGAVHATSGAVRHTAFAGTAFWVPPRRLHSEEPRPGTRIIYVRFQVRGRGMPAGVDEDLIATRDAWHLRMYLNELYRVARSARDLLEPQVRALLGCVLIEVLRHRADASSEPPPLPHEKLDAVLAHVRARIGEAITPGDLARQAGLSLAYFTPLFKRTTGLSPRRWLVQQRMLAAADLLREGAVSIAHAAAAVGCEDANLFSRQFRAWQGMSPSAYERAHGARRRTSGRKPRA